MALEIIFTIVAGLLIVLGALGSILPILPGPPLAYAGLFLYAWVSGFEKITATILVIIGLLTLASLAIDLLAPAMGAKKYKASTYGVVGSILGALLGAVVFGPIGILIGPFLGGLAGEFLFSADWRKAMQTATGSFVGFIFGSVIKVAVCLVMLGYYVYALF